jgi:hypothetical protein
MTEIKAPGIQLIVRPKRRGTRQLTTERFKRPEREIQEGDLVVRKKGCRHNAKHKPKHMI